MKYQSLQKKFMTIVGGSCALMLIATATVVVSSISSSVESTVEQEVTGLIDSEARSIAGFFAKYGGVAKTFLGNPFLQNFFAAHTQRGGSDSRVKDASTMYQLFDNISQPDPNIKSAFFGSNLTGEYFYEQGRVGQESDYFANQRPWFSTAVAKDGLYVTPPAVDSQDGSVSAVVQAPIYQNGKLLGVGGVDILISTIGDLIDHIHYRNAGTAFLLDEEEALVYFPEQGVDLPLSSRLDALDRAFPNTTGFSDLESTINQHTTGMQALTWKGESYIGVFHRISLDEPNINWTLVLLIPADLINGPIQSATTTAVVVSVVIIALIAFITYWASAKITRPILQMKQAMSEIASGDGDLTKSLTIHSNDEVGALAQEFNLFTDKLRHLLQQTAQQTQAVADAARHLSDVSQATSDEIQQEKVQVESVTTAIGQMSQTVHEISANASDSHRAASEVEALIHSTADQAQQAKLGMDALTQSITQGVEVVSGLSKESDNIGAVIDVINSIAEQTNLLALNAAIEAARAGEQGRGFAVVADEVRSLASRTQESTDDIRKMVERLQSMAAQTDTVMQDGKSKTLQGADKTQAIASSLDDINRSIGTVQIQSSQIASATEEQSVVASDINRSLITITGLSDKTARHAAELAEEATQLNGVASELKEIVNQFKI